MVMLKAQKQKFVENAKTELKKYSVYAIMPLEKVPDRLLQKARNEIRNDSKIIIARKTLMVKILTGNKDAEKLIPHITGNSALILTNEDPFRLYGTISSNRIKLAAKPGQISPEDIVVQAGETSIPPGQAVTELKSAGIDVKMEKGKVAISKSKTIVPKGGKISLQVSKALLTLGMMPFQACTKLSVASSKGLMFTEEVLGISPEKTQADIAVAFREAYAITMAAGYVTEYNVDALLKRGYMAAFYLGVTKKAYEPTIVEKLLADAVLQAEELNSKSQ